MPRVVEVKINGLAQLQDQLEHLPLKVSKKIMHRSLAKAGVPWLDEMKSRVRQGKHNFPDKSVEFGVIFKNLTERVTVKSDLSGKVEVGVKVSPNNPKAPFWALFVERGTGPRRRGHKTHKKKYANTGTGGSTGTMPKLDFEVPAFNARKSDVLGIFIDDTKRALDEEGMKSSK